MQWKWQAYIAWSGTVPFIGNCILEQPASSHRTFFLSILSLPNCTAFGFLVVIVLIESLIQLPYSLPQSFRVKEMEIRRNENKEKEICLFPPPETSEIAYILKKKKNSLFFLFVLHFYFSTIKLPDLFSNQNQWKMCTHMILMLCNYINADYKTWFWSFQNSLCHSEYIPLI